jgi:hypothetical protein
MRIFLSHRDNYPCAAAADSHPDRRHVVIQIVALQDPHVSAKSSSA